MPFWIIIFAVINKYFRRTFQLFYQRTLEKAEALNQKLIIIAWTRLEQTLHEALDRDEWFFLTKRLNFLTAFEEFDSRARGNPLNYIWELNAEFRTISYTYAYTVIKHDLYILQNTSGPNMID